MQQDKAYATTQSTQQESAARHGLPIAENHPTRPARIMDEAGEHGQECRHQAPDKSKQVNRAEEALAPLSDYDRFDIEVSEIGSKIEAAIATLSTGVSNAGQDASRYGMTLGSLAGQIGADADAASVKRAIASLLVETQRMLGKTKSLEQRLTDSSREIKSLRSQIETARQEAMTDALTGIANRKALTQGLHQATQAAAESSGELCLLMVDIDHFKRFNDSWGHPLGDQVLKLVARTLVENIKGRDLAARYGGEEFCILLPDTQLGNAVTVADQIRLAVDRKRLINKATGNDYGGITLSIGVARYVSGESMNSLVSRADAALYLAKRQGRNRVAKETDLPADAAASPLG